MSIIRALSARPKRLSYLARFLLSRSHTKWASIFFTRRCNRRCSYCNVPNNKSDELTVYQWQSIIDKLRTSWGVLSINIVGGEPTIRNDLDELIEYMYRAAGIIPVLTSNGDFLTFKRIERLASAGLQVLQISVDTFGENGKSNPNAISLLRYAQSVGLVPVLCSVASSENADQIPDIARMAAQSGIIFNCSFKQSVGGQFSASDNKYPMTRSQCQSLVEFLKRFKRTGPLSDQHVYLHTVVEFTYDRVWKCDPLRDYWLTINADGTLMRCQEYDSPIQFMQLQSRDDPLWREYKLRTVQSCKGCYWQPYVEKERSYRPRNLLLGEFKTLNAVARSTLHIPGMIFRNG